MKDVFYTIQAGDVDNFFQEILKKKYLLIAPVKTDETRFQNITNSSDVELTERPLFPAKEFFFRKDEVIFSFSGKSIHVPKEQVSKRVLFGLRRCDLNAIARQDLVFLHDHKDPYYEQQRKNTLLIGLHCNKAPDPYCFCGSFDLEDCYDIMFFKKKAHYLIHAKSKAGQSFLKNFKKFLKKEKYTLTKKDSTIPGVKKLKDIDIADLYENKHWEKGVDKCLSCSACTVLCPTCYCHEMCDKSEICNAKKGKRVRDWSSCQLPSFTRVAFDHIFRKKRIERFKHRIYHQFEYFKDKHGIPLCVGCGRCISGCPTRIDFVKLINEMKKNQK